MWECGLQELKGSQIADHEQLWSFDVAYKVKGTSNMAVLYDKVNFNGERYRNMLFYHASPRFRVLQQKYVFHEAGTPPQYADFVRDYLITKRRSI